MGIVADFTQMPTINDFQRILGDQLKDIDIGILIPNAGVVYPIPFAELSNREVETSVQVNACHVIYTLKVLVNQLIKRHQDTGIKPAILVTSSGMGFQPVAGNLPYSCTKTFVSFLAQGLNFELKEHVDVLDFTPGWVSTPLAAALEVERGVHESITPDRCATVAFRDLGLTPTTVGALRHDIGAIMLRRMPLSMINFMMNLLLVKPEQERRKKAN